MTPTDNLDLDTYDSRILAELQRDARVSMSALGRRVHLSQPAVTERVRKLELSGVIKGYHAVVDAQALGYGIRAMVRVGRCDYATVVKRIEQSPEVVNAFNLTGEDSWILEIAVQNVAHLDEVVSKFCLLTETSTSIILNVARENHPLLPALHTRNTAAAPKRMAKATDSSVTKPPRKKPALRAG
jgi:Lrp/AsnC family transcriptional regulator, leucine-responsive regulatory protein